jgi:hypothetical protein
VSCSRTRRSRQSHNAHTNCSCQVLDDQHDIPKQTYAAFRTQQSKRTINIILSSKSIHPSFCQVYSTLRLLCSYTDLPSARLPQAHKMLTPTVPDFLSWTSLSVSLLPTLLPPFLLLISPSVHSHTLPAVTRSPSSFDRHHNTSSSDYPLIETSTGNPQTPPSPNLPSYPSNSSIGQSNARIPDIHSDISWTCA